MHDFGEDYFERGLEKRLSLYQNYHFMPERAFPLASKLKEIYGKYNSILDFGCAKGFLVRALRLMDIESYGYDISPYAVSNALDSVKSFIFLDRNKVPDVNVVFGKDVLEHIKKDNMENEMKWIREHCSEACFILPLGENGQYRIAEYGFDKTHLIIENEEWWAQLFVHSGFEIVKFKHKLEDVKDNWFSHHKYGNGIFFLK